LDEYLICQVVDLDEELKVLPDDQYSHQSMFDSSAHGMGLAVFPVEPRSSRHFRTSGGVPEGLLTS
jgi:hypothetical protein